MRRWHASREGEWGRFGLSLGYLTHSRDNAALISRCRAPGLRSMGGRPNVPHSSRQRYPPNDRMRRRSRAIARLNACIRVLLATLVVGIGPPYVSPAFAAPGLVMTDMTDGLTASQAAQAKRFMKAGPLRRGPPSWSQRLVVSLLRVRPRQARIPVDSGDPALSL